jgi:hypothetical protein
MNQMTLTAILFGGCFFLKFMVSFMHESGQDAL